MAKTVVLKGAGKDGKSDVVLTEDDIQKTYNSVDTAGTSKASYAGMVALTWIAENSKERDQAKFAKEFNLEPSAVTRAVRVRTFALLCPDTYLEHTLNSAVAWGAAALLGKGGKGHKAVSKLSFEISK